MAAERFKGTITSRTSRSRRTGERRNIKHQSRRASPAANTTSTSYFCLLTPTQPIWWQPRTVGRVAKVVYDCGALCGAHYQADIQPKGQDRRRKRARDSIYTFPSFQRTNSESRVLSVARDVHQGAPPRRTFGFANTNQPTQHQPTDRACARGLGICR